MNNFELSIKPGRLAAGFLASIGLGFLVMIVAYGLISRFSEWTATRIVPIAVGIGVVVGVGLALTTLFATVKKLELDDRSLRIHMLAGGTKEYHLGQNQFRPKVTHRMQRGRHVGTDRALVVTGPHGEDTHTLGFEPEEFSELIHRLTGTVVPAGVPSGSPGSQGAGVGWAPGASAGAHATSAAARQPLDFPPARFEISRKPIKRFVVVFAALAALFVVVGMVLGAALWADDGSAAVGVIVLFLALALVMGSPALVLRSRARKVPQVVTVAPDWVAFDGLGFNYRELRVIQIKPPGEILNRSAKILTRSGQRHVIPLGVGQYHKMFPDYDAFADLLNRAGTAAAGVVRLDYS